jgi:hypothetical protein
MSKRQPRAQPPAPPAVATAAAKRDLDALFDSLPAKRAKQTAREEDAEPSKRRRPAGGRAAPPEDAPAKRGRRGPAERVFVLDTGERLEPVSMPRRLQDGLPVYKSFESFSDLRASNAALPSGGKCPFDCDCCF